MLKKLLKSLKNIATLGLMCASFAFVDGTMSEAEAACSCGFKKDAHTREEERICMDGSEAIDNKKECITECRNIPKKEGFLPARVFLRSTAKEAKADCKKWEDSLKGCACGLQHAKTEERKCEFVGKVDDEQSCNLACFSISSDEWMDMEFYFDKEKKCEKWAKQRP